MKHERIFKVSLALLAAAGCLLAQDWRHERDEYFHGDWHAHVFMRVRSDLDHIYSAGAAAEKERRRLERTKEELTGLQAKLDQGVWDNGTVNDVIDSLRKSANDQRLGPEDRQVLADDAARIHEYQAHHNEWMHH
ncbi:MAG TPA: hypothetical protein VHU83_24305 [Bryobacteraceae bacterium]|jgi:hypothetical protein|nr:hypothetical protein [Bryobacteraceae bacterium]